MLNQPFFISTHPQTLNKTVLAISLSTITITLPMASHAQDSQTSQTQTIIAQTMPHTTLPTISVTATRTPTLQSNLIAQTTILDEQALANYQGQSVLEVLKHQAGFNAYESGGRGALSNFWLRGMNGKQVLVLVDGIRFGSVSSGMAALNLLPASQVGRVEILYGASGASQYGADAMGGVIQIFSKGKNAQQSGGNMTLGAGSQNSYQAAVAGQYVTDATTVSLSAGHEQTDGINATLPGAYDYFADKDGFKSDSVSLNASHQLSPALKIGMSGLFAKTKTEYDSSTFNPVTYESSPYINTHATQKNAAANAYLDYQQDKFASTLKYGESLDKSTSYDGTTPAGGEFNSRQKQAIWQAGYSLPIGKIIGGAEWLEQSLDSNVYTAKDRHTTSEFIGYQLASRQFDTQANIRHDDNSQYGNKTTYNVGGAYRVTPNTRLGVSYATGYRVPTLNDLYNTSYAANNPALKPEASKSTEVFLENISNGADFSQNTRLIGYHTQVDDLIGYDKNFKTQNIDKATIAGATLTTDWEKGSLLFGANYDYQQAKNKSTGFDDKLLSYHPEHKGMAYIGYRHSDFDIRTEAQYVGKRFTNTANSDSLPDYTLLNISGNYYISPQLTLNTRLNNLTNKRYQTIKDYNSQGINSMVTLRYDWF